MNKKLLKVSEVAEMLSITTAQVLRLVRSRRLPAVRISPRCTRFRPDSIQRFLVRAATGRGTEMETGLGTGRQTEMEGVS